MFSITVVYFCLTGYLTMGQENLPMLEQLPVNSYRFLHSYFNPYLIQPKMLAKPLGMIAKENDSENLFSDSRLGVDLGWLLSKNGLTIKGEKGDTGAPGLSGANGATGATGAAGASGATGPQGPQGPKGSDGPQGIQGVKGQKGAKGDKGCPGNSGNTPGCS